MTQDDKKRAVAQAALEFVSDGDIVGVGTGSTANFFIEGLAERRFDIQGGVASSQASADLMSAHGIPVLELNDAGTLPVYVDGADEVNSHLQLTKGGGGALTREKIVAAASERFVCLIDDTKLVDVLGGFPLPIEVIPLARSYVGREIVKLGGQPVWREDFVTDNGNLIIDVRGLSITNPSELEARINNIAGVVSNGLFARRPADVLLVGADEGVRRSTA